MGSRIPHSAHCDETDQQVSENQHGRARATGEAVFLFGSLAMQRGGVTRAVLARIRLFAEAGIKVRVLLTSHRFDERREEADVRRAWRLPDSVEIRYFWREGPPSGGGAPADRLASARHEPGMTDFSEDLPAGQMIRFFRDGLLVKTKHFVIGRRIFRIDHYDAARRCTAREYYDIHGRLVMVDRMDVATARPTLRQWFDRSGACWLASWLNSAGIPADTAMLRPIPAAYDDFGQRVAQWVDDVLADVAAPVVFSDSRQQDHILLALTHRSARKVAVLHNCHTGHPYRAHDRTKSNWLPLLDNLDTFHRVVCLTHQQRDDIAARFGGSHLVVINHPTPPAPKLRVRRQPGLLVVVSRLERQKRLDHAIRAFARVARTLPHARFDIYGTGSELAALKALVNRMEMTERITFRGFTDSSLKVLAGATATVLSSRFEGFPLVLNEAMGVGTPFVAYDINYGPAEVIRHDVDGLLVPAGDVKALAGAMERVLGDPEYSASLGSQARDVAERFPASRWRAEWLTLFAELISRPPVAKPRPSPAVSRMNTAPTS
jgi:glycosyltransferase involved in cell wall biosynthesis